MNGILDPQTSGNNWPGMASGRVYFETQVLPTSERQPASNTFFSAYESEMKDFASTEAAIDTIRRYYILLDEQSVSSFLHDHRGVAGLLIDAVQQLKKYFGDDVQFLLRLRTDESGYRSLYTVLKWKSTVKEVQEAIDKFDDGWWVSHSAGASGSLNFTYELE